MTDKKPEVTSVSISLSRKEQGALYMKSLRQAARITELKMYLKQIEEMAIRCGQFEIMTAAKAALEPPKKVTP